MKLRFDDTIAAIATPLGIGAISIVRVNGPDAIAIGDRVFRGSTTLSATPGFMLRYGRIVGLDNELVDEVLVAVFRSPHSYTGEDAIEINCHGGVFVTKKVLETVISAGARQADPGEFTKRAFLSGRLDLAQAEAISDLIAASNDRALRNSNVQLAGGLTQRIKSIRARLIEICSLLELELDFAEESLQVAPEDTTHRLIECREEMKTAIASFRFGKVLRDGARVAIVGRPNVGKSSLFNRLLMEDRSIVSPLPGTTRDFLEESLTMNGLLVQLCDTAGLRASVDEIESEGIQRTKSVMKAADIVLLLTDVANQGSLKDDLASVSEIIGGASATMVVVNKADLLSHRHTGGAGVLWVSAMTGEGLDLLRSRMHELLADPSADGSDIYITSQRQLDSLKKSLGYLEDSLTALASGAGSELIACDLRLAADALGEVAGEITTEVVLDAIFSKFCIGK